MANNVWQSDRLLYRGVDDGDEDFLKDLNKDPESFLNAAPMIPVPRSKKLAKEFREWLQKDSQLLAAIICIPVPEKEQEEGNSDEHEHENEKEKEKEKVEEKDKDKHKDKDKLSEPTPIGFITLVGDEPRMVHHRKAEIGITLLPKYHGQGYGTEAIKWVMRWGFKRANLHRIGIGYMGWNERAGRLYQRLGFQPEGRRRDFFWHDGAYRDVFDLSILDHEWRKLYEDDIKKT